MRFPKIIANTVSLLIGIVGYSVFSLVIAHFSGIANVYWIGGVVPQAPPQPDPIIITPQNTSLHQTLLEGAYLLYSYRVSKMEIGILSDTHVQARLKDP